MSDPTLALTTALDNATKVANTPLFTTVIDKITGFKISEWVAEGEVRKKQIHDEYDKAKNNIVGYFVGREIYICLGRILVLLIVLMTNSLSSGLIFNGLATFTALLF